MRVASARTLRRCNSSCKSQKCIPGPIWNNAVVHCRPLCRFQCCAQVHRATHSAFLYSVVLGRFGTMPSCIAGRCAVSNVVPKLVGSLCACRNCKNSKEVASFDLHFFAISVCLQLVGACDQERGAFSFVGCVPVGVCLQI